MSSRSSSAPRPGTAYPDGEEVQVIVEVLLLSDLDKLPLWGRSAGNRRSSSAPRPLTAYLYGGEVQVIIEILLLLGQGQPRLLEELRVDHLQVLLQ